MHADPTTRFGTSYEGVGAAEALKPLAGAAAYWLFTLGLIGTGMLGVPVLAGSSAYALTEAAAWKGSLERKPHRARKFYAVLTVSLILGCALDYAGLDASSTLLLALVCLASAALFMGVGKSMANIWADTT